MTPTDRAAAEAHEQRVFENGIYPSVCEAFLAGLAHARKEQAEALSESFKSFKSFVTIAIGEASTLFMGEDGVFDTTRAMAIVDRICEAARKEQEQLVEALRKIVARCRLEQTGPESDAIEIAREALAHYRGASAKESEK